MLDICKLDPYHWTKTYRSWGHMVWVSLKYVILQRKHIMEILRDIRLVLMGATCWVSRGEGIETAYSTGSSWRHLSIAYFLSFLLPFLFSRLCLPLLLVLTLFYLFWTCIWNIQWRRSLYICILHGLLLYDKSPICQKCCRVFSHHYTVDDDSECPMDYELSLLLSVFSNVSVARAWRHTFHMLLETTTKHVWVWEDDNATNIQLNINLFDFNNQSPTYTNFEYF